MVDGGNNGGKDGFAVARGSSFNYLQQRPAQIDDLL